jgi:N utilization substance protein B
MQRKKAREEAFKLIFESLFQKDKSGDVLLGRFYRESESEKDPYLDAIVRGVPGCFPHVDEVMRRYSINWNAGRISKVTYAILSLAVFEIEHMGDVPVSVSANEAVELAKKYEGPEAGAFINGILGSFIRENAPEKQESSGEEEKTRDASQNEG